MRIELIVIPGLQKKIKALQDTAFVRPMMGEIGMFAMRQIKKRTLIGDDVHGITFKAYNPMYAKERASQGFPVRPVDLTRTGSMLSSMTYDSDRNSVDIFFMNTTDPSGSRNPEKAYFLQQEREFFALSTDDIKGVMDIVKDYYRKLIMM